jgi:hypothetical protein
MARGGTEVEYSYVRGGAAAYTPLTTRQQAVNQGLVGRGLFL